MTMHSVATSNFLIPCVHVDCTFFLESQECLSPGFIPANLLFHMLVYQDIVNDKVKKIVHSIVFY